MKTLLKNGTVVSGDISVREDVLIDGEKIVKVGRNLEAEDAQVVDVNGKLLFPGFIDGHTHFDGHTEIYATYTNTKKYTMMLAHDDLRVVHVSTHVSLRQACDKVKKERVLECIRIANNACKAIGIQEPKIGVAGLNPHCGENGMFGVEEIEEIQPAINEAMEEGINIPEKKPTPPDSIFSKAIGGWYDIVVAMYHDQGHIPLKVEGFKYNKDLKKWDAVSGINVTLGIPIIRVSVDHGTGFDLAGTGECNQISLVNSIDYAIRLAENR